MVNKWEDPATCTYQLVEKCPLGMQTCGNCVLLILDVVQILCRFLIVAPKFCADLKKKEKKSFIERFPALMNLP